mgnify:FL=1
MTIDINKEIRVPICAYIHIRMWSYPPIKIKLCRGYVAAKITLVCVTIFETCCMQKHLKWIFSTHLLKRVILKHSLSRISGPYTEW